jgi:hypothetical protein
MPYKITLTDGDTILVDANRGEISVFTEFFKRGEPVIEKCFERRGVWPFRYNESVEREITPEHWVMSIQTNLIARMSPISDDELPQDA